MKNRFKFTLIALLALLTIACGEQGVSADKYTTIEGVSTVQPDVVEIFSLGCGHCRSLENVLIKVEANSDIKINKTHVVFNESTLRYAYLYYAAEIQFSGHNSDFAKFTGELFALIQADFQNANPEQKRELLSKLFKQYQLIEPQSLTEEHYIKIQKLAASAEKLGAEINLSSVPAILVKGKYLLDMNKHNNSNDLIKTINYLLKL